jgi:hypothetical protein
MFTKNQIFQSCSQDGPALGIIDGAVFVGLRAACYVSMLATPTQVIRTGRVFSKFLDAIWIDPRGV